MRYFIILLVGLVLVLAVVPLVASTTQQEVCERVVQTALKQANDVCTGTERNQACYGHLNLEAQPQSRFEPFKFDEAGDIINITQLKSLRLSPMNVATGTWGVAMMSLQANLSDETPSENVTLVLFGDVEIDNAIAAPTEINVTVSTQGNANIRRTPSDNAFILGTLAPQQVVKAIGKTADGTWLYIDYPGDEGQGWINSQLVDLSGDIDQLNVIDPAMAEYGPMQAFYVRTGNDSSTCEEAPNDGLLIQTPEGAGEVRLWINEVKIRLGSTVYIQARPSGDMTISTLEGAAYVEVFGVEQTAVAGTSVSIPLDENSKPAAPPSNPERYTEAIIDNLPVDNLEQVITVVPPASSTPVPTSTETETPLPTATATSTPTSIPTATSTETPTDTPTDIPTNTPTLTNTPIPPTATDVPPTATDVPPTATDVPPTSVPDDPPTRTEEPTPEVSTQTEEPSGNDPDGGGTSDVPPETPSARETPSDDPPATTKPDDSGSNSTEEAPSGNSSTGDSTNSAGDSESSSFEQVSEVTAEPLP